MHNLIVPAGAPTHFAGKKIASRWPYVMPGELVVANGETGQLFENATFLCTLDKPFETWWMGADVYPMTTPEGETEPVDVEPILAQQLGDVLHRLVKLQIDYVNLDQKITKAAARMNQLFDRNSKRWSWGPQPNTIVRQQGYTVSVSNLAAAAAATFPTGDWGNVAQQEVSHVRVNCEFLGYLLVLEAEGDKK